MNEGQDTHYQPWLRDENDARKPVPAHDTPPPSVDQVPELNSTASAPRPTEKPPLGYDLNSYSPETQEYARDLPTPVAPLATSGPEESWGSLAAKMSKKLGTSIKRGWVGFANWTIRMGIKADVPARVAAMHLDEKAKAAAEAVAEASKVAASKTAEASKVAASKTAELSKVAASKTAEGAKQLSQKTAEGVAKLELGEKLGDVAEKAGETIKKGAATMVDATKAASETVVDATKSGMETVVDATKSKVETVAKSASDMTRKPVVDATTIPSALDQLIAEEEAAATQAARDAAAASGAPPLPLFADLPETVPPQQDPKKKPKPSYRSLALERPQGDDVFRSAEISDEPTVVATPNEALATEGSAETVTSPSPLTARFTAMRNTMKEKMTNSNAAETASSLSSKSWLYALVGTVAIGAAIWGVSGKIPGQPLEQVTGGAASSALVAADINRSDRAEIEAIVHDYILNHPEIIPQAMERYQAKEMAKQVNAVRGDLETPFAGAWAGAANGDVVMVEFADFACGFCRRSVNDVERLLREDKNLKVVHRDLPILSEASAVAAKTALAAAKQGKYRDYYLAQYAAGPPTEASIKAAAAKAGMDSAATQKAFLNGDLQAEIDKNLGFARGLGFNGTPTFIIGDRILQGAVGYEELKKAIAEARAKK